MLFAEKIPFDTATMSNNDMWMVGLVVAATLMFTGAAVFALAWSVKDGQFENFTKAAEAIFDADEPIGTTTDAFPGEEEQRPSRPQAAVERI